MKKTLAEYGRSIVATLFLAVILSGPIFAVVGSLIPFIGNKLVGLIIVAALHLA